MPAESIERLLDEGKVDEALARAKAAVAALARDADGDLGDTPDAAEALLEEAEAQWRHGDVDDAVMTVDEAIGRARRTFGASDVHYASALEVGAEIAADAGMPHAAAARFEAAIDVLERAGLRGRLLANTLLHRGLFRRSLGDLGGAAASFLKAIECATEPGARPLLARTLTALGEMVLDEGRPKESRELATRALEIWVELRDVRRPFVADALGLLGRAALRDGDPSTAEAFLAPACDVYARCRQDVRARHAAAATAYAQALDALGSRADAHDAYRRAIELHREGDDARVEIEQRLLELAKEG